MSNYKRQVRSGRLRDRFRRKGGKPVDDKPVDDKPVDESSRDKRRSQWAEWRKKRREYVIERKKAQAGIAKHRKWVMLWIAVIVVALVVLAIFIMNKMSLTGLIF